MPMNVKHIYIFRTVVCKEFLHYGLSVKLVLGGLPGATFKVFLFCFVLVRSFVKSEPGGIQTRPTVNTLGVTTHPQE